MGSCYRILISGKVQGVFFRTKTQTFAKQLGLKGSVKNLSNGQVEIILQGSEKQLDLFLQTLTNNADTYRIDNYKVTKKDTSESFSDFLILY